MCSGIRTTLKLLVSVPDTAYTEIMQLIRGMDTMIETLDLSYLTYLDEHLLTEWIPTRCFLACAVAAQATGGL
jgi:hypothetical protein